MAICNLGAVMCCMMALLLPVSMLSAQNSPAGRAILTPNGMVTVNGDLVNNSSALLGSEAISTGPESAAHITSSGSDILMAADTNASFAHDSIQLTSGAVLITSRNGMSAQLKDMKFTPTSLSALTKYEAHLSGCDVTVSVREGSITLPDGRVLDKGQSFQGSTKPCERAIATAGKHIPYAVWGLVGAGGAGAAAGVALLNSGKANSGKAGAVSPSQP